MNKLLEIIATIGAMTTMIVVPPLVGFSMYGLWLTSFHMYIPASLAGIWAAFVTAAFIKRGFE